MSHAPSAEQRKAIVEKCRAKRYPQRRSTTPAPKPHDIDVQPDATRILDAALKHRDEAA